MSVQHQRGWMLATLLVLAVGVVWVGVGSDQRPLERETTERPSDAAGSPLTVVAEPAVRVAAPRQRQRRPEGGYARLEAADCFVA